MNIQNYHNELVNLTNQFFEFENNNNLFDIKISNVYFWDIVRIYIHRNILQERKVIGSSQNVIAKDYNYKLRFTFNALKNCFIKNIFLAGHHEILFLGSSRRKLLKDNLWWDIYCDTILQSLKCSSCLLIEQSYLNKHHYPVKTDNILYFDLVNFLSKVTKYPFFRINYSDCNILKKIHILLNQYFNININFFDIMRNKIQKHIANTSFFISILNIIKPKIFFVVSGYTNKFSIHAAKKLQIPVVELQHGTSMGKYHLGYSYPEVSSDKILFPDYLFLFGDFWKHRLSYPIPKKNVISVGFPYFEKETNTYKYTLKEKKFILFISQNSIGKKLSRFAVDFSKLYCGDSKIVYKLHPGEVYEWKKKYPWLLESNIEVIEDQINIYDLFCQTKAIIGVYSTVIYEGLGFGLKTYILKMPGFEYVEELIKNNYVTLILSVDDLINNLNNNICANFNSNYFFRKKSLDNIKIELDKIMKGYI